MVREIYKLREKWRSYRDELRSADYNHADGILAHTMHFADSTPIIRETLQKLRLTQTYKEFDAESWLHGRGAAGCLGCGQTNLRFSLDEQERATQSLKVLELAIDIFKRGQDGLCDIGMTTYT